VPNGAKQTLDYFVEEHNNKNNKITLPKGCELTNNQLKDYKFMCSSKDIVSTKPCCWAEGLQFTNKEVCATEAPNNDKFCSDFTLPQGCRKLTWPEMEAELGGEGSVSTKLKQMLATYPECSSNGWDVDATHRNIENKDGMKAKQRWQNMLNVRPYSSRAKDGIPSHGTSVEEINSFNVAFKDMRNPVYITMGKPAMGKPRTPDFVEYNCSNVQSSSADNCNGNVVVYENSNFSGWSAPFGKGNYENSAFTSGNAENNHASSVKVPVGCVAILYDNEQHEGTQKNPDGKLVVLPAGNYTGSRLQEYATQFKWDEVDNAVSSLQVLDAGKCGLHAWWTPFRTAASVSVCENGIRGQVYSEPGGNFYNVFRGWCCNPLTGTCKITHGILDGWWRGLLSEIRLSVATKAMRCGCNHGMANLKQCYETPDPVTAECTPWCANKERESGKEWTALCGLDTCKGCIECQPDLTKMCSRCDNNYTLVINETFIYPRRTCTAVSSFTSSSVAIADQATADAANAVDNAAAP